MDESFFKNKGIAHCHVSKALSRLEPSFKKKFNLSDYVLNKPVVFFGLYTREDYIDLKKHTGNIYIIFEGHDIELLKQNRLTNYIRNLKKIKSVFAPTKEIGKKLKEIQIFCEQIDLNLNDESIFYPRGKGNKIYVYNGYTKETERVYCKQVYDNITRKISQYDIILSNTLSAVPQYKMPEIYEQCFIGVSLVNDENSIKEMISMGLPVINNSEEKCIRWNFIDDIVRTVNEYHNKLISETNSNDTIQQDPNQNIHINTDQQDPNQNINANTDQQDLNQNINANIELSTNDTDQQDPNLNQNFEINSYENEKEDLLNDEQVINAMDESVNAITENVLDEITQKITENVLENVSKKVNSENYKELVLSNIEEELKKLNLI
jgi:hypothetical protein